MTKTIGKYTIEDGIPIPDKSSSITVVLRTLDVGQSVVFDKSTSTLSGFISSVHQRTGRKFACRTVEGGTRVWRLS